MVKRHNQWYRIRQVAEQTGLSPQLIRQWEARYQAITPHRLENGYRVYHQDDIERLRQLKHLVDNGYSIQNAVLFLHDLGQNSPVGNEPFGKTDAAESGESLIPQSKPLPTATDDVVPVEESPTRLDSVVDEQVVRELLTHGEKSATCRMAELLEMELSLHGIHHLMYRVMIPFLRKVGDLWEKGEWTEYQEHIASLEVRDFLVNFRSRLHVSESGPLLLASCVPGERHEIMLQIILVEAAMRSWRTSFLGTSPAPQAVADAVGYLAPEKVILSVTTSYPWIGNPEFLSVLSYLSMTHRETSFYIGGPGMDQSMAKNLGHVTWVQTIEEFLSELPRQ